MQINVWADYLTTQPLQQITLHYLAVVRDTAGQDGDGASIAFHRISSSAGNQPRYCYCKLCDWTGNFEQCGLTLVLARMIQTGTGTRYWWSARSNWCMELVSASFSIGTQNSNACKPEIFNLAISKVRRYSVFGIGVH